MVVGRQTKRFQKLAAEMSGAERAPNCGRNGVLVLIVDIGRNNDNGHDKENNSNVDRVSFTFLSVSPSLPLSLPLCLSLCFSVYLYVLLSCHSA